ncbi:cell wall integrity and stress response component 1-like [Anopheles merus]|uniref:cell wall integrity and stress response component 1-like n=1 Tax=Anopheles merus TaxID=30066 RepID=UPI001BE43EFE|nr:cell wall integrity and stress response component 1-like [Anopheles merus]
MNTYRRTKKEIARSQTTGSGASKILQDVWYDYEAMSFLHDTVVPRRTLNSANLVKTPTASTSNACSTTTSTAAPTNTSTSTAAPTATSTSTAASTATSDVDSGMLQGRTPSKGQKRKLDRSTRSQQIADCLETVKALVNPATTSAASCSKARALGSLVEAQVATYEQSHPQFCAKLIHAVTTTMNEQIENFYEDQLVEHNDHAYF